MPDEPIPLLEAIEEERRAILDSGGDRPLSALCISGGGIRSATFALGAIQSLAKNGLLPGFDYLSTVSGGGYIGSWLSAWIARDGIDKVIPRLRDDSQPPERGEPDPIRYFRAYNGYLNPRRDGLTGDTWTMIATVIRNFALNWLVLTPLLLGFLMVPRVMLSLARLEDYYFEVGWNPQTIAGSGYVQTGLPVLIIALFCLSLFQMWRYLPGVGGRPHTDREYFRWILAPLIGATLCFCAYEALSLWTVGISTRPLWWYVKATAAPAAATWLLYLAVCGKPWAERWRLLWKLSLSLVLLSLCLGSAAWLICTQLAPFLEWGVYVIVVPPLIGFSFYVALAIFAGISSTVLLEEDREWMSRASAYVLLYCLFWIGGSTVVLLAPAWVMSASWAGKFKGEVLQWGPKLVPGIAAAAGWAASAKAVKKAQAPWMGWVVRLAPTVFIVALAVALAIGTNILLDKIGAAAVPQCNHPAYANRPGTIVPWTDHGVFLEHCSWWSLTFLFLIFLATSLAASRFININRFSPHALYRERLVRAYLGASNPQRYHRPESSEFGRKSFTGFRQEDNVPMYLLARRPFQVINVCANMVAAGWRQRQWAPFTISPLHCGSPGLGYRPSKTYGGEISLGTAMTLSGAGEGPATSLFSSPLAGFAMTLLNSRPGAWLGNPGPIVPGTWHHPAPRAPLQCLLRETFGLANDQSPYLYLSDGGHFDNLALYEMVRRRCGTIVVLDGSCDAELAHKDLANAIQKIQVDLHVAITFCDGSFEPVLDMVKRCAIGEICYPNREHGRLIYVKPLRQGKLPPEVASYVKASKFFPHEAEADQLLSESQTEACRKLGELTMDEICAGWTGGAEVSRLPGHIMETYFGVRAAEQPTYTLFPGLGLRRPPAEGESSFTVGA
jgi:hypothetical protein